MTWKAVVQVFTEHYRERRGVKAAGLGGKREPCIPGPKLRPHGKQREDRGKAGPKLNMTEALEVPQEICCYRKWQKQRQTTNTP